MASLISYSSENPFLISGVSAKLNDNMYTTVDGATEKESNAAVVQGYTEQSNVNVVAEMVDMITITRAYEANQKMIKAMDSMMDKAVNQAGRLG